MSDRKNDDDWPRTIREWGVARVMAAKAAGELRDLLESARDDLTWIRVRAEVEDGRSTVFERRELKALLAVVEHALKKDED